MKYFSFVGRANIARVHVHDPEIAIAETKIDGIATETGTGTAIGTEIAAIATAIVGVDRDRAKDEIGTRIVTAAIGTGRDETEIGIETEGGRGH